MDKLSQQILYNTPHRHKTALNWLKMKRTMKTTLTTILILLTLSGFSQSLMLGCRKNLVRSQMRLYPEFHRTVKAKDYLEYQKDSVAIGFRFINRVCFTVSMTVPASAEYMLTSNTCWDAVKDNLWRYETNIFDSPVLVKRERCREYVTFTYWFEYE